MADLPTEKTVHIKVTSCADCYFLHDVSIHQAQVFGYYSCGLKPRTEEEEKTGNRSIFNSWLVDKAVESKTFDERCPLSKDLDHTIKRFIRIGREDTIARGARCPICNSVMVAVLADSCSEFRRGCPDPNCEKHVGGRTQ